MKRMLMGLFIGMMVLSLSACSFLPMGKGQDLVNRGMKALNQGDYQEAIDYFDRALDEGSKQDDLDDLYEILTDYLAAKQAYEVKDYQRASRILEDIDDDYKEYDTLRKDVRSLQKEIDKGREDQHLQEQAASQVEKAEQAAAAAQQAAQQAQEAASQAGQTNPTQNSGGYLFPSDTQYLTTQFLDTLPNDAIDLIRNEIYARHGYIFNLKQFADYFNAQDWYRPTVPSNQFNPAVFNEVEQANLKLLVEYQGL